MAVTSADINQLKALKAQAAGSTRSQMVDMAVANKDFIRKMMDEYRAEHGKLTPKMERIARQYGLL